MIEDAFKSSIKKFNALLAQEKRDSGYFEIFKKEWEIGTTCTINHIHKIVSDPILLMKNIEDPDKAKYTPYLFLSNDATATIQNIIQKALLYKLMKNSARTLGEFPTLLTISGGEYKEGDVMTYQKVKKVTSCMEMVKGILTERYIIDDDMRFIYIEKLQGGQMKILKCCLFRYIDVSKSDQYKIKELIITIKIPGDPIITLTISFDNYQKCEVTKDSMEKKKKQLCEKECEDITAYLQKLL